MDINKIIESYDFSISREYVNKEVSTILEVAGGNEFAVKNNTIQQLFSCIDLTRLQTSDNNTSITKLINKINEFADYYPDIRPVAGICVYPSFTELAREKLKAEDVNIVVVAGAFPTSQSFLEVKISECRLAAEQGADDIDVVIPLGILLEGHYQKVYDELRAMKDAVGNACFKVILETGELMGLRNVKIASIIAMEAGADFIKTSTGKVNKNATFDATYIMCKTIKEYEERNCRKIGIKVAGGISNVENAIEYATIVSNVLGECRLHNKLFRFGASNLANSFLKKILSLKGLDVKSSYF